MFYLFVTGPAPENVTNDIYSESTKIETYELCKDMMIDLDRTGYTNFDVNGRKFYLEIIDSVNDYVGLMKKIFDFKLLKEYLSSGEVNVIANGMNGGEKLYYLWSLNLWYLGYY